MFCLWPSVTHLLSSSAGRPTAWPETRNPSSLIWCHANLLYSASPVPYLTASSWLANVADRHHAATSCVPFSAIVFPTLPLKGRLLLSLACMLPPQKTFLILQQSLPVAYRIDPVPWERCFSDSLVPLSSPELSSPKFVLKTLSACLAHTSCSGNTG